MTPGATNAAPSTAAATFSRRATAGWIAYDVAAHGYALMIPTVAYALYFTSFVAVDTRRADSLWSLAAALSLLLAGLLAPLIGVLADQSGRHRHALAFMTVLCAVFTASLATAGRGDVLSGIALFVLAQVTYILATSLYNSFLPLLANERTVARISGLAWGVSYLGGILCLLLCFPLTRGGIDDANATTFATSFLVTAAFLLTIGLPAISALPSGDRRRGALGAGDAYRQIWRTMKGWKNDLKVPRFLLAYYLINDAIVTVLYFAAIMLKSTFGLEVQEVLWLSLALQVIAVPSTIFFGWLGSRWSQRGATYLTLAFWLAALVLMAAAQGRAGALAIVGALGLVLGSTQALFRSMYASMVPPSQSAEYFGFHALVGRASAALGPLLFGLVNSVTGSQRMSMLSLGIFVIAGAYVLTGVGSSMRSEAPAGQKRVA